MAIQIKYAQSYMQPDGKMTADVLLSSTEPNDIVIGVDPMSSDATPKPIGPRFVICLPANQPCYAVRLPNLTFNDPFKLFVHRCISGPNCAGPSCSGFSTTTDASYTGTMVEYTGSVPSSTFGTPHPVPSNIQSTCAAPPPPPPPTGLNITGVTAELSSAPGFEGQIRINVTATGSGIVTITVDGTTILTDGPLNPGSSATTYTYLKPLPAGSRYICAVGANRICTTFNVPTPAPINYQGYTIQQNAQGFWMVTSPTGASLGGYDTLDAAKARVDAAIAATQPPPPPKVFTIKADKSTINIGDTITFSGQYYIPNTTVNIYYQTVVAGVPVPYKNHLASVLTDQNGNYSSSMILTTIIPGVIRVGTCSPGALGFECGADVSSNTVDITISSTPPTGTAIDISQASYGLGDTVSIKTCAADGYMYIINPANTQTFKADIPKGACRTDTYTIAIGQIEGTYKVRVANYSNITLMEKTYTVSTAPKPIPITLKADKSTITSGDIITFSGTYAAGQPVNIFIEGLVRKHLAQIVTDSSGNFTTNAQITDTGTLQIKACNPGIGFECAVLPDITAAVTIVVNPVPTVALTMIVDKTSIADGDTLTVSGTYKPNSQVNIYYQTIVAGFPISLKNHLTTVNTDASGKYSTTMTMTVSLSGTIRVGACNPGGLGVECGDTVSNTVDITVTTAAPPTAFTLSADKASIKSGDTVTFTGKYKPSTKINIYVEGIPKTHITETTTLSDGTFSASAKLTSDTSKTVDISACTVSLLPGVECEVGGVTSNTISVSISPPGVTPPPTPGLKWKLNPDLTCTQPTDNSGTYDTKDACLLEVEKKKQQGGISPAIIIGVVALGVIAIATMKKPQ